MKPTDSIGHIALLLLVAVLWIVMPVLAQEEAEGREPVHSPDANDLLTDPDAQLLYGASSVRVIKGEDLLRLDADNVVQALVLLPEVHVTTGASGTPRFRLRGYEMEEVQVTVDGIPLSASLDGVSNLELIHASQVEKIVVVFGPSSVLEGPGAIGGAIHVTTKRSVPGNPVSLGGRVSARGEPRLHATARGTIAGRFGYVLSGSFQQSDGYHLSEEFDEKRNEDGGKRNNSDRRDMAMLAKLDYSPVDFNTIYLTFDFQETEYGIPGHVRLSNPGYLRVEPLRRWTISLGDSYRISDDMRLSVRVFRKLLESTLTPYDDSTYTTRYDAGDPVYTKDDTWGLQQAGDFDLGKWSRLRYSLWYQRDTHRDAPHQGRPWNKYVTDTFSAGVEDLIAPHEDVNLTAGVSVDGMLQQFTSGEDDLGDPIIGVNGFFGVSYSPFDSTILRVSFARKNSLPKQNEVFPLVPELTPQVSHTLEAGWSQGIASVADLDLSGFYSMADDLIVSGAAEPENEGAAQFAGGTLSVGVHPWSWVNLNAGYTLQIARNDTENQDEKLEYRPIHKAVTNLQLTAPFGTQGDVRFQMVGDQHYVDQRDGDWNTLGAYYLLDLRVGQRFLRHFLIWGSAENVLDFDYETEYGFPQRGRTFWFGLEIDMDLRSGDAL